MVINIIFGSLSSKIIPGVSGILALGIGDTMVNISFIFFIFFFFFLKDILINIINYYHQFYNYII